MVRTCVDAAHTALLLLLLAVLAAAISAGPLLQPHASVWTPAFPTLLGDVSARGYVTIPLAGAVNSPTLFALYGELSLGSPPQRFRVVFETDEDAVWIPNFRGAPPSTRVAYDHSKSQTYEPDGAGAIAAGATYAYFGFRSRDTLRIGNWTLANATFVEATQVPEPSNFDDLAIDGMFGLSPRLENNAVLAQLVRTDALTEPVFAFYLPRTHANSSDSVGELVIGAVDSRRFSGTIQYVDTLPGLLETVAWVVPLESVDTTGGTGTSKRVPLVRARARANIMATLPIIVGPKDDVARLAKAVGAHDSMIDCAASGPDIAIDIGGVTYVLTKSDYILPEPGSHETCRWAFVGMDLPDTWLFGQPFLQAVYTVFAFGDGVAPPRMGFAQAA